MQVISNNPRLVDLGGNAYLVKDKFIYFTKGGVDIDSQDGRAFLLEYADTMFDPSCDFPRAFGRDTVGTLSTSSEGGYDAGQRHVDTLPDAVRDAIKEVRDAFGL